MCWYQISDLKCTNPPCRNIVDFKGHREQVLCQAAEDGDLGFGGCGSMSTEKPGPIRRAKWLLCEECKEISRELSEELYTNAGQHATTLRESEQSADDQRRRRLSDDRTDTPRPGEQYALVAGAGTGWSAGQGGRDLGASGVHLDPGTAVSAMPQELDLDDVGEGPSQGHGQGYSQGGSEGHDQRGGQGSGS